MGLAIWFHVERFRFFEGVRLPVLSLNDSRGWGAKILGLNLNILISGNIVYRK